MNALASVKTCPDPWACSPASIHHCGPMVVFHTPLDSCSTLKEARIRMPETTGMNQLPRLHVWKAVTMPPSFKSEGECQNAEALDLYPALSTAAIRSSTDVVASS